MKMKLLMISLKYQKMLFAKQLMKPRILRGSKMLCLGTINKIKLFPWTNNRKVIRVEDLLFFQIMIIRPKNKILSKNKYLTGIYKRTVMFSLHLILKIVNQISLLIFQIILGFSSDLRHRNRAVWVLRKIKMNRITFLSLWKHNWFLIEKRWAVIKNLIVIIRFHSQGKILILKKVFVLKRSHQLI